MSTSELKYDLHRIIEAINDNKTLKAIYTLLSSKATMTLTSAEKAAADEAIKSISKGATYSHKQAMASLKKKYPTLIK